MAEIRLQDVTRVFSGRSRFDATGRSRQSISVDRAFADRVDAQRYAESAGRGSHAGPVTALDNIDLVIPDGQTFAVVGPSGCGKSTLLRVVAGLDPSYTGRVYYDGEDMTEVPPKDRYIGMVFQNYALYPHFESEGNLAFFFRVRKAPDEEAQERIRITSEMMGIGFKELLARKPGTLSGGQQQRVAIARAIVRNPRLFLFDEPLSNLDAKLRTQTRVEIKRLLRRFQITSIYVTHSQVEAVSLGDQIAVMREGRIEQVARYNVLRERPANAFVAGFLGKPPMNLLSGGVVEDGRLQLAGIAVPLPASVRAKASAGQSLTLGVRPEAVPLVGDAAPAAPHVTLQGVVEVVEPDYPTRTQLVYARSGDLTYAAQAPIDWEPLLNVGDSVTVAFILDRLHFFDTASEKRLE
jgi:ABC-type sugar transport system ATPase subunit